MTTPDRRALLRLAGSALVTGCLSSCVAGHSDSSVLAAGDVVSAAPAARVGGLFDPAALHTVDIAMSEANFAAIRAAYAADRSKAWVEARVTIDGTAYSRCGVRLKGNSTIWRVPEGSGASEFPWLVRLDKFVDGQAHHGVTEIVVRLNNSASALNEAMALELLGKAGLATQPWAYAVVSVAGAAPVLRLVVEHPSDPWAARTFAGPGILYKAEAQANYDYLGEEPAAYVERFDVEAGADNLTALIAFLKWSNQADDAAFAAGLGTHLDVDAFATYLALEDLVDNYDAIDGPGNNSYLWWAADAGRMTVVGWDHNLTFGVSNRPGAGGAGGAGPGGVGGAAMGGGPGGGLAGGGAGRAGPGGGTRGNQSGNILARRFEADAGFAAAKSAASTRLRAELVTSGYAAERLDAIAAVLARTTADYLPAATLATEKAAIAAYFA